MSYKERKEEFEYLQAEREGIIAEGSEPSKDQVKQAEREALEILERQYSKEKGW